MPPIELTKEELACLHATIDCDASDERLQILTEWGHGRQNPAELRRQLDVLESFHQDVASRFADSLSRSLQRLVEVQLIEVSSMAYSEFAFGRSKPTCYFVLQAPPLPTLLAIDVNPAALFPILDCLLGGGRRPCPVPDRAPTELEQRLAQRVIRTLLDELHDAWEPLLAVDLSVERIESDAQRVRVVAPGEAIAKLGFRVRVAEQTGELSLCLPHRAIRKMVDKLLSGELRGADAASLNSVERLPEAADSVADATELLAYVDLAPMTSAELANLRVGDIMLSDADADGLIDVLVGGQHQLQARPGSHQGRRAISLIAKSA